MMTETSGPLQHLCRVIVGSFCLVAAVAAVVTGSAASAAQPGALADQELGDQEMAGCLAEPGAQDAFYFTHQISIFMDGRSWYFQAPELELNFNQSGQAQDLPGHCWQPGLDVGGLKRFIGKHYNTGPVAAGGDPQFWSSDAGEHEMLYWVDLVISEWSPEIAQKRARDGYVHYHELVLADDGCFHPKKVAWMRHSAMSSFTFDGGPPQFRENGLQFRPRNQPHEVGPGIDISFPPNYDIQYLPELRCGPDVVETGGGVKPQRP